MADIKLRPVLLHEEDGNQKDGNGQIIEIESKSVSVTHFEKKRIESVVFCDMCTHCEQKKIESAICDVHFVICVRTIRKRE